VLTREDLLQALTAIRVMAPVRAEEVTASTNETAARMAEDGAPEWTLVSATHQTEGHGRQGRTWEDVPGRALLFSVVLRPAAIAPNRAGMLSLLAGASMAETIRGVTGRRVTCKWPNDLVLHDRKVGGILLESSIAEGELRYVVVGIGVNLDPPEGVEGAAGIGEASMRDLLVGFLERFQTVYDAGEPSFPERVRIAWLPVAATIGRLVEATTTDGRVMAGRATGLDGFGALKLSTDSGEVRVGFGDVQHIDQGSA
jgi:BirA family biotin operon repressor/biotin-[acetyl-CoA-carboxylase] ligase